MDKYLTQFADEAAYNAFLNTNDCPYVNVSYIEATDEVKYFKDPDMAGTQPFTVKILAINEVNPYTGNYEIPISFQINNSSQDDRTGKVKYKINNGNWIEHTFNIQGNNQGTIIKFDDYVGVGDEVQFICESQGLRRFMMYSDEYGTKQDTRWEYSGNVMSTIWGDQYQFCNPSVLPLNYSWYDGDQYPYHASYAFFRDFGRPTSVENLVLPTRQLPPNVFCDMFNFWTDGNSPAHMTTPCDINAPEIPQYGCRAMFREIPITKVPQINSTYVDYDHSLAEFCKACTSLVNDIDQLTGEPEVNWLSIKEIKYNEHGAGAFNEVFAGCTSLKYAPKMNLTNIDFNAENQEIFVSAFAGCSSLIECDWTICYNGYSSDSGLRNMFRDCTNLTKAPIIDGPKFEGACDWGSMFYNCQSLQELRFKNIAGPFWFSEWPNCPQSGTIYVHDESVYLDPNNSEYYGQTPLAGWTVKGWSEYPNA